MDEPITLYLSQPINESSDPRTLAKGNTAGTLNQGPGGWYGAYDYRVWDGASYGRRLQSEANPGGKGYSIDVHDCGAQLSVTASYQSPISGKKISQSFIVILQDPKTSAGTIFMTSTKWRTVSTISQAASYINSTIRSLAGQVDR